MWKNKFILVFRQRSFFLLLSLFIYVIQKREEKVLKRPHLLYFLTRSRCLARFELRCCCRSCYCLL